MSLRSVNLNLLPALDALLTEKSVTRAAGALGLSQPAMSEILGRLRGIFNDQLLVRVGQRTSLTPRAIELIAPTKQLCAELECFFATPVFDPALSTRRFVVAGPDFGALLFSRIWLPRLAEKAPGIRMRFVAIDLNLPQKLADRQVDFVILPEAMIHDLPPQPLEQLPLSYMPMGKEVPVALFRAGHPLDRGAGLSQTDIASYRVHTFHPDIAAIERRHRKMMAKSYGVKPHVEMRDIAITPFLLLHSDDIAIVPQSLALLFQESMAVSSAPLSFAPAGEEGVLAWSSVQEDDLGHQWFRREIVAR